MKLYELTNDILAIFERLEEISGDEENAEEAEAWKETLDGIQMEFSAKAENIAAYIKALKSETDALKAECDALNKRRRSKEKAAERMRDYLLGEMQAAGIQKIDRPRAAISIRNNPESAEIPDESKFIEWALENKLNKLLRFKAPEVNKTAVKEFIKSGNETPFAQVVRKKSVSAQ